jgi:hypothetical protein
VFLLVALDDVFLWLHSPYLAIPLTLVIIVVVVIFITGGKSAAGNIVNMIKGSATQAIAGLTTKAAASIIKKDS